MEKVEKPAGAKKEITYFGTDGIRQEAEKFSAEFLARIIKGLVDYAGNEIKVFLAGDTRESSEWILADLESALETFGVEYSNAGVLPTPAINYCFYEMGFDFAIDVTASHNPYTDNGIKIFERTKARKLGRRGREKIEAALREEREMRLLPATLREDIHDEAVAIYREHLKTYLGEADFSGLRIGLDCANGATSVIGGEVFKELGAEVSLINARTDYNTVINRDSGSTHLEGLRELVKERGLDFGFAFDGDGDRCLAIDENGETVDGDQMLAILADFLGLEGIVTTVMAGQGLLNWAKENNLKTEITAVGDANVAAAMIEKGLEIGSEQSGHVILPGETTGDGMLTALMLAKAAKETGRKLGELAGIIKKYPQILVNVEAGSEQKQLLKMAPEVKELLLEYDKKLKAVAGRLLVRPSGTENLIRITMWGEEQGAIDKLSQELKQELIKIFNK